MIFKIYVFFSVFFHISILISTNYIHLELDGDLISREQTNFSLFIKHFKGVVFYGIDRSNKVLIELEEVNNEKEISLKFDDFSINQKSTNICGCPNCSDVYMTFVLQLDRRQIAVKCNNQSQTLQVDLLKASKSDQFEGYPVPNMYNQHIVKTYIFMGNIGPYKGPNFMEYLPLYNQLTGCLDKFYFNGKLINIHSNSSNLKSPCSTQYIETIHRNNSKRKFNVFYNISDCSVSSLNGRYCIRKINRFNQSLSASPLRLNDELFFSRHDWTVSIQYQNMCLMEILLSNGNAIIFYVENGQSLVVRTEIRYGLYNILKLVETLDNNSTYTMITNFTSTHYIIRLSSGEDINTFVQDLNSSPISINIGISRKTFICKTFKGLMDFQYKIWQKPIVSSNISSVRPTRSSLLEISKTTELKTNIVQHTTIIDKKNEIKITSTNIILITGFVFLMFLFILFLFYFTIRKEMRSHIRKISCGAMSSVDQHQTQNIYKPHTNVYELEGEHVYVSSRDSAGYEILPYNV